MSSGPNAGADDGLRLDLLVADDWERLRALRLAALGCDPDVFFRSLDEEREMPTERWRERLEGPAATWLAVVAGADVGMATCLPGLHDGSSEVEGRRDAADPRELVGLWVAPTARGLGVAGALVGVAAGLAREGGASELRLWLADSNAAACALYDRLGAVATGRTGAFPPPREHLTEHERSLAL